MVEYSKDIHAAFDHVGNGVFFSTCLTIFLHNLLNNIKERKILHIFYEAKVSNDIDRYNKIDWSTNHLIFFSTDCPSIRTKTYYTRKPDGLCCQNKTKSRPNYPRYIQQKKKH